MLCIIRVDEESYYALENAVWFVAPTMLGPWAVATSVPAAIYSVPPSSPLHYVTYVKVYRSTPEVVYVGYTPGYYGTVVSSTTTTVVYGTGWYYPPYLGTYWYGAPYTYGIGVASTWSSETGWSLTLGVGYYGYPYYYPWGGHGAITDLAAGVRHGGTVGEAMPALMFTDAGGILPTRRRRLRGRPPTREIMEHQVAP